MARQHQAMGMGTVGRNERQESRRPGLWGGCMEEAIKGPMKHGFLLRGEVLLCPGRRASHEAMSCGVERDPAWTLDSS